MNDHLFSKLGDASGWAGIVIGAISQASMRGTMEFVTLALGIVFLILGIVIRCLTIFRKDDEDE